MAFNTLIELNPGEIPVVFEVDLGGTVYLMGINNNMEYDFLTVDLFDSDSEALVLGEKMIIDRPLFEDYTDDRFPGPVIIPSDTSKNETKVTANNLGVTVFLYIDDGGDSDD
ncbi:hypothetical protein LMF32_00845 [Desemzia sp. C1]|uniref:phage baseplate plug family protein n=1 Tax=Desemzia sp. C1 TaxID=2892016 RepID=UPI001E4FFEC1|nr:hypothetical protein [Desemzia sp. C1]MCI3027683.1 hypothetical protein [Desemzia sp. C1]